VSVEDLKTVQSILLPSEYALWITMNNADCQHSLTVLRRFELFCPVASMDERRAALLHDIGKTASDLSWLMRVLATVVGSHGERFRRYHDHERIGVEMLQGVSTDRTLELLMGDCVDDVGRALKRADNI
jgi:putative nucleotidyltransferase with HDIG domain